jgi:hypothetical protein
MTERPHDIADLYLAPVVLNLDANIDELAALSDADLAFRVALVSDEPDWTGELRRDAILRAVEHLVEMHGWTLAWDDRGIRASHGRHSLVLGVPASFHRYVVGAPEGAEAV